VLNLLDSVIETVINTGWAGPGPKPDLSFEIPDQDFRTGLAGLTLNIYLAEIRENKEHRRPQWDRIQLADRTYISSQAPSYFDCHYLISAWSTAQGNGGIASAVAEEHAALGGALFVLVQNPEVIPAAIGVAGGGPVFSQAHVFLTVAAPDIPRVVNDFWSTMSLPWRPTISLIATAPTDPQFDTPPSPPMITLVQRFGSMDADTSTFEELIQMGGWVLLLAGDAPVANATVERVETGETAATDSQGRFIFGALTPGIHRFRVTAPGFTTIERDLDLPGGPPDRHIFRMS
jgi:hypothetical protein